MKNFLNIIEKKIWAANDIKIFNRMMTQRNVELQLQAIDMIERKHRMAKKEANDTAEPSTSQPYDVVPGPGNDDVTKDELE